MKLTKIRQLFPDHSLKDPGAEVEREMGKFQPIVHRGARIAIALGSRGIHDLVPVVRAAAGWLQEQGALPFVVPAMGSHGGATAEGQEGILAGYGISEAATGIPVRSSMEVVQLPGGDLTIPVYMDKMAFESDGVILINRVKPHTDYHATYESGLVKMTVIGLGNEKQAAAIHRHGIYGLSTLLPAAAKQILQTGKIIGGIALVENAYDRTMLVKALKSDEFLEQEPGLLDVARKHMPSLPVRDVDVLIIDRMGKDISGIGIDPNIIGRTRIYGQEEPDYPDIKAIVVLDLSDHTNGNAMGVGLADVITKTLYDRIDFSATYTNVITSSFLERGKIPIVAGTPGEAFETALRSCGYLKEGEERVLRIRDTLHLDELYVSGPVLDRIEGPGKTETIKKNVPLFTGDHDITPF